MKAVFLDKTGKPDVLTIKDIDEPVPGPGEVLVGMEYIGINYADILSRKGLYGWAARRPYVPGMEGSGIIESVGEGVTEDIIGKRVIAVSKFGLYSEKVVIPLSQTMDAIEQYTAEENASFLVNYLTAWVALFKMAKPEPGEKLLVTAAAGGVGTAAVQLASKYGAAVYGMTGSRRKCDLVISIGAKRAYNYRDRASFSDLARDTGGMDIALELVGGHVFRKSMELLNPFGRIVVAGFASLDLKRWNPLSWISTWRDIPRVKVGELAKRSVSVMATHIGYLFENDPGLLVDIFSELKKFVTVHDIRPVIGRVFPFDEVREAHRFIESRESTGKVLLKI